MSHDIITACIEKSDDASEMASLLYAESLERSESFDAKAEPIGALMARIERFERFDLPMDWESI